MREERSMTELALHVEISGKMSERPEMTVWSTVAAIEAKSREFSCTADGATDRRPIGI